MWKVAAGLGLASAVGQYLANRDNRRARNRQEGFQERMSNTSWQRGVRDMELAGINPILAYKQGGASTPQGASYTSQNMFSGFTPAYQAASTGRVQATQAALNKETQRKIITEIETQIPAAVRKMDAEGLLAQARIGVAEAEQKMKIIGHQLMDMDKKSLEKLGLSMSQLQYAPKNQLGSLIIDKMVTMFGRDPGKWEMSPDEIVKFMIGG